MLFAAFKAVQAANFARQVYTHYREEVGRAQAAAEAPDDNSEHANKAAPDDIAFEYLEEKTSERSNPNGIDWDAFKTSARMHATALGAASYRAAIDSYHFNITGQILQHIDRNIPRGTAQTENERNDPTRSPPSFADGHADFTGRPSYRVDVTYSYDDKANDIIAGIAQSARDVWDYGKDIFNRAYSYARGYFAPGSDQEVVTDTYDGPHDGVGGQDNQKPAIEGRDTDADLFEPVRGEIQWGKLDDRTLDDRAIAR